MVAGRDNEKVQRDTAQTEESTTQPGKGFLTTAGYVELALGTRIWTKATDLRSRRGQAS